jgi:hypothetical protein
MCVSGGCETNHVMHLALCEAMIPRRGSSAKRVREAVAFMSAVESLMRHLCWIILPLAVFGCSSSRNTQTNTPKEDAVTTPIACSLTPEDLRSRRDTLLPGLIRRADRVSDLDNGLRLEFKSRSGLLAEVAQIMEQERGCCGFLRFQLTVEAEGGAITLDVTGPEGTREVLRSL